MTQHETKGVECVQALLRWTDNAGIKVINFLLRKQLSSSLHDFSLLTVTTSPRRRNTCSTCLSPKLVGDTLRPNSMLSPLQCRVTRIRCFEAHACDHPLIFIVGLHIKFRSRSTNLSGETNEKAITLRHTPADDIGYTERHKTRASVEYNTG